MRMRFLVAAIAACLAACGPYPDDVAGTLDAVEAQHRIRLGLTPLPDGVAPTTRAFLARLAERTGARIETASRGSTEQLFTQLEAGQLDLVITEVAKDSPWLPEVAVIEPLAKRRVGEHELGLSAVARNGENRWIMLLEAQARDMRGGQ